MRDEEREGKDRQMEQRGGGGGGANLWCRSLDLCNAQRKQASRCMACATGYGKSTAADQSQLAEGKSQAYT